MNVQQKVKHVEDVNRLPFGFIDLAKVAHDLKGPLNSIKGLLIIAGDEVKEKSARRFFRLIGKYQQLLYTRIDETLNKVTLSNENMMVTSNPKANHTFGGYRLSLRNVGRFAREPFSEEVYRENSVFNIMKVLHSSYYGKGFIEKQVPNIDIVKLAHDIKGPLNSIKGLLDIARNEVENESARNYFELIAKCQQQLYSRVEETLRRVDGDVIGPKLTCIEFEEMVEQIRDSLRHMDGVTEIDFSLRVENFVPFYSDPDAIYSIIQNLLENAIKYRKHDHSRHSIDIEINDNGNGVAISITDNGIGIKEELMPDIFKFRVRDESSSENGHGIGLALVKQLTERLEGQISVESKYSVGSKFTVEIPNSFMIG